MGTESYVLRGENSDMEARLDYTKASPEAFAYFTDRSADLSPAALPQSRRMANLRSPMRDIHPHIEMAKSLRFRAVCPSASLPREATLKQRINSLRQTG